MLGRKENRRNQVLLKVTLATAMVNLLASMIKLATEIIAWLNR